MIPLCFFRSRGTAIASYSRAISPSASVFLTSQVSPLDDLAFDMYQDPEVARLIRRLNEKKREAVEAEKFDAAKTFKETILKLQKVIGLALRSVVRICLKSHF